MSKVNIMAKVIAIAEKRDKQVELSKIELELGAGQDLQKANATMSASISKAKTQISKLDAMQKEWSKIKSEYDKQYGKIKKVSDGTPELADKAVGKSFDVFEKVSKKLKAAADDLGINVSDIKGYSEFLKLDAELYELYKDIDKYNFDID
jgi:hypothetical protein